MFAEKEYGRGHHEHFDPITVDMSHPDAFAALVSGRSQITAHFGAAPLQYVELTRPTIHRVLNSSDDAISVARPEFVRPELRTADPGDVSRSLTFRERLLQNAAARRAMACWRWLSCGSCMRATSALISCSPRSRGRSVRCGPRSLQAR